MGGGGGDNPAVFKRANNKRQKLVKRSDDTWHEGEDQEH